jgi:hypothetical protein
MVSFCKGIVLPQGFPSTGADLLKDYDITTKTLTVTGATNVMTLIKQQAGINDADDESRIIDKIDAISDDKIKIIIEGCGFTGFAVSASSSDFKAAVAAFNADVKTTYCVYQNLYRNSLNDLFLNLSTASTIDSGKNTRAITLAKKIIIILAGINRIERYLREKSSSFITSITSKNIDIDTNTDKLKEQIRVLESKSSDADLYKRMVEYTEEKNKAHRNLLSLYAMLNIVGLGLIFYIAKE